VAAALQAGYTPDEIQKLDGLRNVGMDKVARTIKASGPDGKEYEYQVRRLRPQGRRWDGAVQGALNVNQGNQTTFLSMRTRSSR
jgi:hypothetical protein